MEAKDGYLLQVDLSQQFFNAQFVVVCNTFENARQSFGLDGAVVGMTSDMDHSKIRGDARFRFLTGCPG